MRLLAGRRIRRVTTDRIQERTAVSTVALLVTLEARAGQEAELASFLTSAVPLVQDEPQTTAWFAARLGPSRFAIFDTFPDEAGREAHLAGRVAAALMERAPDLLAQPPSMEHAEILAEKLP
jgi:quinol monooxygenase YgiN